jgi:hypothetical protein
VTAVLLALFLVGSGVGLLTCQALAAGQAPPAEELKPPKEAGRKDTSPAATLTVKNALVGAVDAAGGTVSVKMGQPPLAVQIVESVEAPVRLEGLKIHLLETPKLAVPLKIEGAKCEVLKGVTVRLRDVTALPGEKVKLEGLKVHLLAEPKKLEGVRLQVATPPETKLEGLPVGKDARILIKGRPGKLADLKAGMRITLELGMEGERLVVKSLKAE